MAAPALRRGFWRTDRGRRYLELIMAGRLRSDEVAARLGVSRQAVAYQAVRFNPSSLRSLAERVSVLERIFNDSKPTAKMSTPTSKRTATNK